jgi:hypothetical protein
MHARRMAANFFAIVALLMSLASGARIARNEAPKHSKVGGRTQLSSADLHEEMALKAASEAVRYYDEQQSDGAVWHRLREISEGTKQVRSVLRSGASL